MGESPLSVLILGLLLRAACAPRPGGSIMREICRAHHLQFSDIIEPWVTVNQPIPGCAAFAIILKYHNLSLLESLFTSRYHIGLKLFPESGGLLQIVPRSQSRWDRAFAIIDCCCHEKTSKIKSISVVYQSTRLDGFCTD